MYPISYILYPISYILYNSYIYVYAYKLRVLVGRLSYLWLVVGFWILCRGGCSGWGVQWMGGAVDLGSII